MSTTDAPKLTLVASEPCPDATKAVAFTEPADRSTEWEALLLAAEIVWAVVSPIETLADDPASPEWTAVASVLLLAGLSNTEIKTVIATSHRWGQDLGYGIKTVTGVGR